MVAASATVTLDNVKRHSHPYPVVRTYLSSLRAKTRVVAIASAGLASLVLTLLSMSLQSLDAIIVFGISLTLCLLGLIKPLRSWFREVGELQPQQIGPVDLTRLVLEDSLLQSNFVPIVRMNSNDDVLVSSREVNQLLWSGVPIELRQSRRHFRTVLDPPAFVVLLDKFAKDRKAILFNGRKVRMATELKAHDSHLEPVTVQRTTYFDGLVTNESAMIQLVLRSHPQLEPVYSGLSYNFPRGALPACDESASSNQIGVSTIAITRDFRLVIQQQGSENAIDPGKQGPSGSGSADWADVKGKTNFNEVVIGAARRELVEECGLSVESVDRLQILGYGRLMKRGGLPEFYCFAKLRCDAEEISIVRPERHLVERHVFLEIPLERTTMAYEIHQTVNELLKGNSSQMGSSLWWNLWMLGQVSISELEQFLVSDGD